MCRLANLFASRNWMRVYLASKAEHPHPIAPSFVPQQGFISFSLKGEGQTLSCLEIRAHPTKARPMNATLLVMAGGALGAAARYHLGRLVFQLGGTGLPYGTLAANLLGGLLMGVLVGVLARGDFVDEPWRLLLGVGLLGGFTTFSAFSLEVLNMIERGNWGVAIGYAMVSVIGSVLALFAGLMAVRALA